MLVKGGKYGMKGKLRSLLIRNPATELRFSDEQIALIVFRAKPHFDSAQCSSVTATSRSGSGMIRNPDLIK